MPVGGASAGPSSAAAPAVAPDTFRPGQWAPPASYASGRPWPRASFKQVPDVRLREACEFAQQLALALIRARATRRPSSVLRVAWAAGIDHHTLAAIERGEVWPGLATVLSLVHELGLELRVEEPDA